MTLQGRRNFDKGRRLTLKAFDMFHVSAGIVEFDNMLVDADEFGFVDSHCFSIWLDGRARHTTDTSCFGFWLVRYKG